MDEQERRKLSENSQFPGRPRGKVPPHGREARRPKLRGSAVYRSASTFMAFQPFHGCGLDNPFGCRSYAYCVAGASSTGTATANVIGMHISPGMSPLNPKRVLFLCHLRFPQAQFDGTGILYQATADIQNHIANVVRNKNSPPALLQPYSVAMLNGAAKEYQADC